MSLGQMFFVIFIFTFSEVQAHSTGAPQGSCENLTPGHGLEPQNNDESVPVTCTVNKRKIILILFKNVFC